MNLLEKYSHAIENICAKHKVKRLYAFGSVLSRSFSERSDIDLMVDFDPIDLRHYADNYFSLKFALEETLHRPVDLLEEKAVKNLISEKQWNNSEN